MRRRARLVVVGHGMLASHALARLTRAAPDDFDITVFGAEPGMAYNRVLLSSWLAGDCGADDLVEHDAGWHAARRIRVCSGDRVVAIDRDRQCVRTHAGVVAHYDHLLLATGSRVAIPDVPGRALPGVHGFRTREDVAAWLAAPRVSTLVVGGGVLGIEAAHGLAQRGATVTLVHAGGHLMDRELDAEAAAHVQAGLARRGIAIVLSRRCSAVLGDVAARGVVLDDGRVLRTGRVVFTTGITPETALARACDLPCERGVLVDARMRTADPRVSAVGECAQQDGRCHGLLAPLHDQVEPWVHGMLGRTPTDPPVPVPQTRLKVPGMDVFVAGDVAGTDVERVVHRDDSGGIYRELRVRGGRLVGVRLCGDSSDAAACVAAIRSGAVLGDRRFELSVGCEAA